MGISHMNLDLLCSMFYFYAIVLLLCFRPSATAIHGNETDRLALLKFKAKIISDPLGVTSSWNDTIHFCQWYGVTCGHRHQRITTLNLQSSKLVGSISPYIGNMSFLRDLQLQNNSFIGNMPPEVGHLHRLHNLILHNNSIGGEIPSNISSCSNLIYLVVSNNRLVGGIPTELGFMLKLQYIEISTNNLSGSIPPSLGNLSSLSSLYAAENNLVGNIPDALSKLKKLTLLALPINMLSGTFPPSIMNLSSITDLDLADNHFQGNLPSELRIILPNLRFFSVAHNQFTGSIPGSISNASNLESLFLNMNKLIGDVPSLENLQRLITISIGGNFLGSGGANDLGFLSSLTNATMLEEMVMDLNNFGGVLPETISNLSTKLAILALDKNKISGHIPTGIENLAHLQAFAAQNNQLTGIIPPNIGKLQNLRLLVLSGNRFSGNIPPSLGNLTNLLHLHLSQNNFQGLIPSSLQNCQQLLGLDLSLNSLSGGIPAQVLRLPSLSIALSLAQNHLTGSLPVEVESLKNLGEIDISENKLSGEIPSSIGSCTRLETLNMQGNSFQGLIPSSLGSLRGLRVLDISHNNFSGEIPEFLASFVSLQTLNLSYNNFEGKVPIEGVFKNATAVALLGNNKLCGGMPKFKLPVCNFKKSKKRKLNHSGRLLVAILSGFLGFFLLLSLLYIFWYRKEKMEPISSYPEDSHLNLSYRNLFKATQGFSSENLIGAGSFGSVYKGTLDQDGAFIAVKVLNLKQRGASKSFKAECDALRNIRHRNLVKVLTACSSVDYHGNDFKALVYEFMVNGSLEDWLHPPVEMKEGANESLRQLNLSQRLNIAIDVSCALDYLHHHCGAPIVHCDLKPSNVLLDGDMTGHVGDFGLAKFLSKDTTNSNANQSSSAGVRGTIGYASPEYGMGNDVSTHGDVYSFGILLLEMFTGKRPTDGMFKEGLNLHNFAKAALPEGVIDILDPIILQEIVAGETSSHNTRNPRSISNKRILEGLISIFGIGLSCSAELPNDRLDISDAAAQLCCLRNKLLGTQLQRQRQI